MDINNYGQYNVAYDNATIHAIQILNYQGNETPPKMLTLEPIPIDNYVYRNEEEDIICALEKNKILLLNGIGGVGKTSTAKKIFEQIKEKYDYLAWIDYKNNWQHSLVNSFFASFFCFDNEVGEKTKYKKIVEFITNLQNNDKTKRIVIFIDNYNKIDTGELYEIRRLPVNFLITTRCTIYNLPEYRLDVLNEEMGSKLFKANFTKHNQFTFKDEKAIEEIVKISHGYPLALELIAKSISYTNMSIVEFLIKLKKSDFKIDKMKLSANSNWNGLYSNEDIAKQISKVYKIADLGEKEQEIIKIISILPPNEIILNKDIQQFLPFECKNEIIVLICKGWITSVSEGVKMHEIICECIYRYNTISYSECQLLLDVLENKTRIEANKKTKQMLIYAEYSYNIISIMKDNIKFCRHLFVKEGALILKECGSYKRSHDMLNIIINSYDENNFDDLIVLAELHNNRSKILSMEFDIDSALNESTYAEILIDKITWDKSENYYFQRMIIKKTVAMHYVHKKKYKIALEKMNDALQCVSQISDKQKYQVANLYSDYSMLLSSSGDIIESIKQYKYVLSLYDENNISQDSPWRFTTYTNLSDSLIYNGQFILANNYEFQALLGKYKIYQEDNYAIANTLLGMGHIYRCEKKLWDIAALFYNKALKIYERNLTSDGYCNALAGLSIVKEEPIYASKAYDIIMENNEKIYMAHTYTDVMFGLLGTDPEKSIQLGLRMISEYTNNPIIHPTIQYAYALMGKASYLLGDDKNVREYLQKADDKTCKLSEYFYHISQEVINSIPFSKE